MADACKIKTILVDVQENKIVRHGGIIIAKLSREDSFSDIPEKTPVKGLIKEIGNIYSEKIIAFDIQDEINLELAERRILKAVRKFKEEEEKHGYLSRCFKRSRFNKNT